MNGNEQREKITVLLFKFGLPVFCAFLVMLWSSTLLWAACPQPRNTKNAPEEYYKKLNPLEPTMENILQGKSIFEEKAKPLACKFCHGSKGDGNGIMAVGLTPAPRDFTCARTIDGVPDGQLFWIIMKGALGKGMPSYEKNLDDTQAWQVILYVRKLAKTRIAKIRAYPDQVQ